MRTSDLTADVFGVHLVHHVTERAEIILAVIAVDAIVDSYETDIVLGKVVVCVLTDFKLVSSESR